MNKKVKLMIQILIFIVVLGLIAMLYHNLTKEKEKEKNINWEESSMEVLKITSENFEQEVLKAEGKVLIDFYADWCGPCKMMAPTIETIAKEYGSSIKVGKINIDDNQDLAIKYGVMSIPTLIVFEKGEPTKTLVGVQDKDTLVKELGL